jgi:hypothetical protein
MGRAIITKESAKFISYNVEALKLTYPGTSTRKALQMTQSDFFQKFGKMPSTSTMKPYVNVNTDEDYDKIKEREREHGRSEKNKEAVRKRVEGLGDSIFEHIFSESTFKRNVLETIREFRLKTKKDPGYNPICAALNYLVDKHFLIKEREGGEIFYMRDIPQDGSQRT